MKKTAIALSILAAIGTGYATAQTPSGSAAGALPDCFASNHDAQRDLFTIRSAAADVVNQQCLLHVGPRANALPAARLAAGNYTVYLSNGGGGGAGGTMQGPAGGGGAGGGGAGAKETQTRVTLAEGVYKLTIGAGGPGGRACVGAPFHMGGGPGWLGSPSNIVRVATGDALAGTPGADSYVRPSRAQLDKMAGRKDGHGGSGPGQTSGGHGGDALSATGVPVIAEPGQSKQMAGSVRTGGAPGGNEDPTTAGGGGGATSRAEGGGGGGEAPGHSNRPPQAGSLGSGGGGGEGGRFECDPGARGGHGFIALRRN